MMKVHSQAPVNTPNHTPRRGVSAGGGVGHGHLDNTGLMYAVSDVAGRMAFTTAGRHDQTMEALGMISGTLQGLSPRSKSAMGAPLMSLDSHFSNSLVQPLAAPTGVTVYESTLHDKHTVSSKSHQRRSGTPSDRIALRTSSSNRPRSAMGMHSAHSNNHSAGGGHQYTRKTVLDRSLHVPDAACCGYRQVVEHTNRPKGLFVTFCQNDLETQLCNAKRDLECCQEQLEAEKAQYRENLGSYMFENHHMKEKIDNFDNTVREMQNAHEKEKKDLKLLKEEYEKRWRDELETEAELRRQTESAQTEAKTHRLNDGGLRFEIQELNRKVETLQNQLKQAERDMENNARANKTMHDERSLFAKKCENLERERIELLDTIKTKNAVISGLEKELGKANDKLSSVSFFREQFGSPGGGAGGGKGKSRPKPGVSSGSVVKDRLYQKYFGRMN